MKNIKFIIYTLSFCTLCIVSSLLLLYIYDPLQIFHKSYFDKPRFFGEMRLGARGIIEHYDFDSYIIGTSMLQNTSAKEANEKLGGNFVNISPAASTIKERAIILNFLFKNKSPKTIIYSLDAFSDEVTKKPDFQLLYDESKLNDLEAYLNDRFIICALTFSTKEKCVGKDDLETLLQWEREEKHQNRFGGFENWIKFNPDELKKFNLLDLQPIEFNVDQINIDKEKKLIKNFTLSFIKNNPNTYFHLILPPYSRFHFHVYHKAFIERKQIISWLLQEIKDLDNVQIYAFDTFDYPDNIANYAGDTVHYNKDINSIQLDAIKNQTNILTLENVDSYFNIVENKIKNYDMNPFIQIFKDTNLSNLP